VSHMGVEAMLFAVQKAWLEQADHTEAMCSRLALALAGIGHRLQAAATLATLWPCVPVSSLSLHRPNILNIKRAKIMSSQF
jgi:hypothetical protein